MSESSFDTAQESSAIRLPQGRFAQFGCCFARLLRQFFTGPGFLVLPVAAVIAAVASLVARHDFLLTMEGDLKGAAALSFAAVWNGCAGAIRAPGRDRDWLLKARQRGLRLPACIAAHLVAQLLLALVETALTLGVCALMGLNLAGAGTFTPWLALDMGITLFGVSLAAAMLCLFVGAITPSVSAALTALPYLLAFQLLFCAGVLSLPAWTQLLSEATITTHGFRCLAAQADLNNTPSVTAWNLLNAYRDEELSGTLTLGDVLNYLSDENNTFVQEMAGREIGGTSTIGQMWDTLKNSASYQTLRLEEVDTTTTVGELVRLLKTIHLPESLLQKKLLVGTVGELLDTLMEAISESELSGQTIGRVFTVGELLDTLHVEDALTMLRDVEVGGSITVGEVINLLVSNPDILAQRDLALTFHITVGRIVELIGTDTVRHFLQQKSAAYLASPAYSATRTNILLCWRRLGCFICGFGLLTILTLAVRYRRRVQAA